ncbi:divergent PAP2 family protein [Paenibacillus ehimensis]|uniref:Divergent PAP2 family protein n=1 Tax=Paenibacillus ehimensis TaxID=79264 RepID=A0ABT8V8I9_9BACL|nr:divergent PAP2 family protein [Paenibacillus ehimensis]MDO3677756.1 divergent PAP2 family protein [Paenibacillus ehimensis]
MNRALWTSLAAIGTAQALKIPDRIRQSGGRFEWLDLFRTGGMPSSHSAGVVSLATYIGLKKGPSSISFSLAAVLSLIVMYDAMGIRRHAGMIASEVNQLEDVLVKLTEQHPRHVHQKDKELEERLGHLPEEVLGGAAVGAAIGWLSYMMEFPKHRPGNAWASFIRKSLYTLGSRMVP